MPSNIARQAARWQLRFGVKTDGSGWIWEKFFCIKKTWFSRWDIWLNALTSSEISLLLSGTDSGRSRFSAVRALICLVSSFTETVEPAYQARRIFHVQSLLAMIVILAIGLFLIDHWVKKALTSLNELTRQIKARTAENLDRPPP